MSRCQRKRLAAARRCWLTALGYILYSDLAEDQSIDQVVPETVENFSEAMKEGLDLVTRDILNGGTNVVR